MNNNQATQEQPKTRKPGSGGRRKGAGPKIGSQNALKLPENRRSVKKMVTFLPREWEKIQVDMKHLGHKQFNNHARDKLLED